MVVEHDASALGQDVGKLFEQTVVASIQPLVEQYGHSIAPEELEDATGNNYQIDAVIRDAAGDPIILLDPKYIRYTKHNRDKGSWLCVAHYNLRKTHPSIRKTIAVLAGNWSASSVGMIRSFGVEVINLSFDHLADVLASYGVEFAWGEKDRETPRRALEAFRLLGESDKNALAARLVAPILPALKSAVQDVVEADLASTGRRISAVEVLLKTDRHEMLLLQYGSVKEALQGITTYVEDINLEDIKNPPG